jgi:hypothetical protein
MRPGQIDKLGPRAFPGQAANVAFDRDAGIIANPLFEAREAIEQGTFA